MISKIGEAILALISAWVPGASVAENILNLVGVFAGHARDLGVDPMSVVVKDALKVEASIAAIANGDVAILGVATDIPPFPTKRIAVFATDEDSALAKRLFGT